MPIDRNVIKQEVQVYAETLLGGAKSENAVFEVGTQIAAILEVTRRSMRLRDSLADESIPAALRSAVVDELFSSYSPSLLKVMRVMVERGDIGLLSRVNEAYIDLEEAELGAIIVDVTSAVELDDHLREVIKRKLERDFDNDILLREHVDKGILGGIIMSAHGRRIDASLAAQLERAREALTTEQIGGDK